MLRIFADQSIGHLATGRIGTGNTVTFPAQVDALYKSGSFLKSNNSGDQMVIKRESGVAAQLVLEWSQFVNVYSVLVISELSSQTWFKVRAVHALDRVTASGDPGTCYETQNSHVGYWHPLCRNNNKKFVIVQRHTTVRPQTKMTLSKVIVLGASCNGIVPTSRK